MKILLIIVGWFGVALMAISGVPAFTSSLTLLQTGTLGSGAGYFLTFLVGLLGSLLFAPATLGCRSKPMAIAAIAAGAIYVATFFGYAIDPLFEPSMIGGVLFMMIPVFLSIAASVLVLKRPRRTSVGS